MPRNEGLSALLDRPRPSQWSLFWRNPITWLCTFLYHARRTKPRIPNRPVTVVCLSDTHNTQPEVPPGDILIHAGDLSQSGTAHEVQAQLDWLNKQPHEHKLVIGGNHDAVLDPQFQPSHAKEQEFNNLEWGGITFLHDSSKILEFVNGRIINVFGSPYTPQHGKWAFQYPRTTDLWANIKDLTPEIDILITHGPPKGHLDRNASGCTSLLKQMWRVRPLLHIFGHIHEGYGTEWAAWDELQRAYEVAVQDKGGLTNLARVLWAFLRCLVFESATGQTLLVNAAMVGGLRDNERRRPVVVQI